MMWTVLPGVAGGGPALVFEVKLRITALAQANAPHALTQARLILDFDSWINFQPPWCRMDVVATPDPTVRRRLETVAWICGGQMGDPGMIRTVLDFFDPGQLADGTGILQYRLAQDPAAGWDGQVSVDEGSLVVHPVPDGAVVTTTKRVQFSALQGMGVAEAEMLAVLIWMMGYPSMAELFVQTLAGDPSIVVTIIDPKVPVGGGTILGPPGGGPCGAPTTCQTATAGCQTTVEGMLDECFSELRCSASQIASGQYGAAAYLTDVMRFTRHLTQYGNHFLTMGSNAISSAKQTSGSP
jgi:hypothetical protein